jgi:hypothetical protein
MPSLGGALESAKGLDGDAGEDIQRGGGVLRDAGPHSDPLGAVRAVESKLQHAKRRIKLTI